MIKAGTDRPSNTNHEPSFPWISAHFHWLTVKRLIRSFDLFRRYSTSLKIRNLIQSEIAFRRHDIHVKTLPYLFRADPTNQCVLSCPYCWRSKHEPIEPASLSYESFVEGFGPFQEMCLLASFQMFGEPTLSDALPDMIHYVHEAKAATYVSTSLQQGDKNYLKRLLSSGLDLLTIALDAVTPRTYRSM